MIDYLLFFLVFGTLGAATIFAWRSSQVTEDQLRRNDNNSTLASDGPDTRD